MTIYDISGNQLNSAYDVGGNPLNSAYDISGNLIYSVGLLPVPTGDLTASEVIPLPDLYEQGKGFTCTGLATDGTYYYVGDIGTLNGTSYNSQIVVTRDFVNVERTIPLHSIFPSFSIIQGITVDTSDNTLWCCDAGGSKIYHLTKDGSAIGNFSATSPTGIAYSSSDDTLWVLNYSNKIIHMTKTGTVLQSYDFAYSETLDQCFLDEGHGYLYITAGTNYTSRNNVYLFNAETHEQSIACTVDSYSVEGIWIGGDEMIIVNDGYYHSSSVNVNQANFYSIP